jgi:hypothetical protein
MDTGLKVRTLAQCGCVFVLLASAQNNQSHFATPQTPNGNVALQEAAVLPHPPQYPPATDADPSVRHEVVVPMPTRLSVDRKPDCFSVAFDLAAPRRVKITVGKKMSIGVKYEMRVYAKGDPRPQNAGVVGYASVMEPVTSSEPNFLNGATLFNSAAAGIPAPGKHYIIEEDVSLFETAVPPQHLWLVEIGRRYTVLWAKRLRTVK